MTDWNNLLNSVNQKVIGIINSTKDSFTGDGVFENKERLGFLLKTAEEKEIKILRDAIDSASQIVGKKFAQSDEIKTIINILETVSGAIVNCLVALSDAPEVTLM